MMEEIEVQSDAKESFTKVDENRNVKDVVGAQMTEIDTVVSKEFAKEGMSRNPKSPNKIILEYNEFMHVGSRELLTYCGAPSGGLPIGEDAFDHQPVEILLYNHRCDPL